ncbi:MAG: DUF2142 domain-containing protein [Coriobacteriia bacterium]|nr:DUF2142 domain-containing protein [Coriobacteriia bacterium]
MIQFAKHHWKGLTLIGAVCALLLFGLSLGLATNSSKWVILFAVVACALLVLSFYLISKTRKKWGIEKVFLILILVLGLTYSAVFPPHTVPDEIHHYQGTYKFSNYFLGYQADETSFSARQSDYELLAGSFHRVSAERYNKVLRDFTLFSEDSSVVEVDPLSTFKINENLPQLRVPAAIGISIARLLNLGSDLTFYSGRFFNLLFFALLAYFAVRITPRGKIAMMAIALLPMTLHVVSSYSYDAGTFGLAFLVTALFLKAIYSDEKLSRRLIAGIIIASVLLAPCKTVYSVLVLLALLIPSRRFSSRLQEVLIKVSIVLLPLASVFFFSLSAVILSVDTAQGVGGGAEFVRGDAVGTLRSMSDVFVNPFGTLLFFLKTLDVRGGYYFDTMIGNSLAWFQPEIISPFYLLAAFTVLLLLAFLKSPKDESVVPLWHKALYTGIAVIGVFAVLMSMYLYHTFTTDFFIEGVQGRYFIPFLPLIALVFHNKLLVLTKDLDNYIIFAFCFFNLLYMVRTFAIASTLAA